MNGDNQGFNHVHLLNFPLLGQLFMPNPLNGMKNTGFIEIKFPTIQGYLKDNCSCNPKSSSYGG